MSRALLTVLAYLVSLAGLGAPTFLAVLVLAGPHAGLLPQPLEIAVVILGWLVVLVAPAYVASRVWRRLGRRS